jgi:hypothetical protein
MKKTLNKPNRDNLPDWSAVYGVEPNAVIDLIEDLATCVHLETGWFVLLFGMDTSQRGYLYVQTLKGTFWCSDTPLANAQPRKTRCRTSWVYAIDGFPIEFFKNGYEPTVLSQGEFEIAHGTDASDRPFLHIKSQASNINLLFRDPASDCTSAWNPLRAEVVVAVGTCPIAAPKQHEAPFELDGCDVDSLNELLGLK